MTPIILSQAGNLENQDRATVITDGPRTLLCVADGAGGRSGGTEAAMLAIEFLHRHYGRLIQPQDCVDFLAQMDAAINKDPVAGETTLALAVVTAETVFGVSVGDSGIWLIPPQGPLADLTARQQRKPFVGSGSAWPVIFRHPKPEGMLLLATDGLLKYTSTDRIVETCRRQTPDLAVPSLLDLVKYPSGRLPDDVTLILTRLE